MVAEHTFVTKKEAEEAFRIATDYLCANGFQISDGPRPLEAEGRRCEVIGFKKGLMAGSRRAGRPAELPQSVWMEYDRGRVVVGVSVYAHPPGLLFQSRSEFSPTSPSARPYLNLLFMIALSLEGLLAHETEARPAPREHWDAAEGYIADGRRRWRRREGWKLGIVAALIVGFLGLMILAARSSGPRPARAMPPRSPYRSMR